MKYSAILSFLQNVQHKLFSLGSYLATDQSHTDLRMESRITDENIQMLEQAIDELDAASKWKGFILPSFTMGCGIMAVLARYSRSSMLETLREDYVRTARAKGQKESLVMFSHAFRNSLIQVVTILGLQIGGLLSGSVLTETVFSIPGISSYLINAVKVRDVPVVMGTVIIVAIIVALINLVIDLIYAVIDPRVKLGYTS